MNFKIVYFLLPLFIATNSHAYSYDHIQRAKDINKDLQKAYSKIDDTEPKKTIERRNWKQRCIQVNYSQDCQSKAIKN